MSDKRSQPLMLSKRAEIFYLEKVRVSQRDGVVVYCKADEQTHVEQFFNIPDKNTALLA